MKQLTYFLSKYYNKKTINLMLDYAINRHCELHFLNKMTGVPQPLTIVQLMGIKKFGGVIILLETGQSYEPGFPLDADEASYQEIRIENLFVDPVTMEKIVAEFGPANT